ncbi:MAG: LysR family transcriptional regulator [Pseudomonadota bacterium]|nr:LysR family transcriptional regulator [Pseudomonadota bacterium]
MDIRQLRYFCEIAKQGSFSAAAKTLGLAQPTLSHQIAVLEQDLDTRLFHRTTQGVSLTGAGQLLVQEAAEIITSLDRVTALVRGYGREPAGDVTIGLPSSVSMVLSVPLAETVRIELPDVRLKVIEAMSGHIQNWLEDRSIDMGFLYDVPHGTALQADEMVREGLGFLSAPDAWPFDNPSGSPVSLADLASVELVLPSRSHGLRRMLDQAAADAGITLDVPVEMDALAQIKAMVSRGSGFTVLSSAAAFDFVSRGELIMAPIATPRLDRPVYLVRHSAGVKTPAALAVEQLIATVLEDLVGRGIWQAESQMTLAEAAHGE